MDNPITIIVPIDAKQECRETVRARLVELAAATRKENGNEFYVLHEAVADPNQFIIYECWKSQAALDFHMRQDYLTGFLRDSETLLQKTIIGTICREIEI